jgi:hypothetical protein
MVRKRISLLFLVLSLVHMPLTHAFSATECAKFANECFVATVSHVGNYARQHPILVASASILVMVCAVIIGKKMIRTEEKKYREFVADYNVRNFNDCSRIVISKNGTYVVPAEQIAVATIIEPKITTDEIPVLSVSIATHDIPVEAMIVDTTEQVIVTNEEVPFEPEDTNKVVEHIESVERKTLVTVEMTPLYEQSGDSYDAYLQ